MGIKGIAEELCLLVINTPSVPKGRSFSFSFVLSQISLNFDRVFRKMQHYKLVSLIPP
jgi:hypothetical protein